MIITLSQLACFFFILARIAGLMQFAPVFNSREIFAMGKIAIVFWTSTLIVFVVPLPKALPDGPIVFALALVTEFMIGALIGFTTELLLIGIEFAGSLMDTQAGLSSASLLDPYSGRSSTLLSTLLRWIAVILFLNLNGHHMLLSTIHQSFRLIPIGSPVRLDMAAQSLLGLGSNIFSIAVHFSAPIVLIVFLIDFCFGMLSKIAPQVNVFQLGFQVKPILSLLVLMLALGGIVYGINDVLMQTTEYILRMFMAIQP